jgi:hypothetical protein
VIRCRLRFLTDRRRRRDPSGHNGQVGAHANALLCRPQTLGADRGHSDKEWCGYISVRVLKPADMQSLWLKNNSPCGEIMVGCACTNAQAETSQKAKIPMKESTLARSQQPRPPQKGQRKRR